MTGGCGCARMAQLKSYSALRSRHAPLRQTHSSPSRNPTQVTTARSSSRSAIPYLCVPLASSAQSETQLVLTIIQCAFKQVMVSDHADFGPRETCAVLKILLHLVSRRVTEQPRVF
mmetsp:Transcript_9303/g.19637  ORF Transcript_9303/g.19637 Transcript_9303/m.19637 type:complete len:116 (+) Transcript_9303:456-803(+)